MYNNSKNAFIELMYTFSEYLYHVSASAEKPREQFRLSVNRVHLLFTQYPFMSLDLHTHLRVCEKKITTANTYYLYRVSNLYGEKKWCFHDTNTKLGAISRMSMSIYCEYVTWPHPPNMNICLYLVHD